MAANRNRKNQNQEIAIQESAIMEAPKNIMKDNLEALPDSLKEMEAQAAALKAALEEQKAMIRAAKQEAKRIEAEIKAAKKASPKRGEFDILADLIKEMGLKENGFSKRELHLAYLEALGLGDESEYSDRAARKLASINAQLGSRIMPKMNARGIKAIESRAAIGKAGGREKRYFSIAE